MFNSKANISSEDSSAGLSSPPATVGDGSSRPGQSVVASIPAVFTPSIKRTLKKPAVNPGSDLIPLPEGLDTAVLKSRLNGKKIKYGFSLYDRESLLMESPCHRGALLTPKEMEDLTESWKPYRSLGKIYLLQTLRFLIVLARGILHVVLVGIDSLHACSARFSCVRGVRKRVDTCFDRCTLLLKIRTLFSDHAKCSHLSSSLATDPSWHLFLSLLIWHPWFNLYLLVLKLLQVTI